MNKRTWKEAACEVAWNKAKKIKFYGEVNFNPSLFLTNQNPFRQSFDIVKTGIRFNTDFPTFRAAFMKWLNDSEAKL